MSLNIENAPAIAASAAVGAVLPLSQRVEERHRGQDTPTSCKGLHGLAAASGHEDDAPHLVLEDISFVERPTRDEAEDHDEGEDVAEAEAPRLVAKLIDARTEPAPAFLVSDDAMAATPTSTFPGSLPPDGTFGRFPAGVPLPQPDVPVPALPVAPTRPAAPAAPLPAASIPGAPAQQGDSVLLAPLNRPAAVGVPAGAVTVTDPATSLPPAVAAAVPAQTGEAATSLPPSPLPTGTARRSGTAQHDATASKAAMAEAAGKTQGVQRPVDAPAPAPAPVEPVAQHDTGHVTAGQGDPSPGMTPTATVAREAATQQAEQRTGQEAGQARSQESTQTRRHVQHIQQVQQTNDMLAARSAAPQISYPFLTWGPGNAAVVQLQPGQAFTVQPSSSAVRQALTATAAPEGFDLQVLEPTSAEPVSETDPDPEEKRRKQSERDPS